MIRRAEWPTGGVRGSDLLSLMKTTPPLSADVLQALESIQNDDRPPTDEWR